MTDRQIKLSMIGNTLGHQFDDQDVAWESAQASGANSTMLYPGGNKRMAITGDRAIRLVILEDTLTAGLSRGYMVTLSQKYGAKYNSNSFYDQAVLG